MWHFFVKFLNPDYTKTTSHDAVPIARLATTHVLVLPFLEERFHEQFPDHEERHQGYERSVEHGTRADRVGQLEGKDVVVAAPIQSAQENTTTDVTSQSNWTNLQVFHSCFTPKFYFYLLLLFLIIIINYYYFIIIIIIILLLLLLFYYLLFFLL